MDPALLCEDCGYELDAIREAGACPECGRAIGASLPEKRVGSAWQRRPGPRSWVVTNLAVFRHPLRCWERVRVEWRRSFNLLGWNLAAASVVLASAVLVPGVVHVTSVRYALIFAPAVFALLGLLTIIEFAGLRFFGPRRGWRTTPGVAWAVCGHASAGWIVTAALVGLAWHGAQLVDRAWIGFPPWGYFAATGGGFLAGLVVFETLVYVGFARTRFANPPGAGGGRGVGATDASAGR